MFIVKRMIDGDRIAFKYFFDKYYADLCNFVNIYLKDTEISEEVVQDIFVYFWENKSKIAIKSSVRSYLFSASKYRSLNELRQQKSIRSHQQNLFIEEEFDVQPDNDYFLNIDEFKLLLENAIQELPSKCKEIFLLSKKEELTNKQIADQLNLSVKTVENQMTIALKKLRTILSPHREKLFTLFIAYFISI